MPAGEPSRRSSTTSGNPPLVLEVPLVVARGAEAGAERCPPRQARLVGALHLAQPVRHRDTAPPYRRSGSRPQRSRMVRGRRPRRGARSSGPQRAPARPGGSPRRTRSRASRRSTTANRSTHGPAAGSASSTTMPSMNTCADPGSVLVNWTAAGREVEHARRPSRRSRTVTMTGRAGFEAPHLAVSRVGADSMDGDARVGRAFGARHQLRTRRTPPSSPDRRSRRSSPRSAAA